MNKTEIAIKDLQEYEPSEGYYLAFSGGKDSIVCKDLLIKARVKFDAHYSCTTIDPPDLLRFIKDEHPDTIWDYPIYKGKPTNLYKLIQVKGLPTRTRRWCCEILKEGGGKGRIVILGVKAAESRNRAKRQKFEYILNKYFHKLDKTVGLTQEKLESIYMKGKSKKAINIILDWTDEEVWEYIRENDLKYCKLYDEGWERIGCIGCPMAKKADIAREFKRYPVIKKNIIKALRIRMEKGYYADFSSAEEVMEWWLSKYSYKKFKAKKQQAIWFE